MEEEMLMTPRRGGGGGDAFRRSDLPTLISPKYFAGFVKPRTHSVGVGTDGTVERDDEGGG
jgi:hypothetical protein